MSSVITSTSHKIIMLLCKWKLYLVCRLAGYAATLSCLPKAGDLPDHTLCIYLSLQMHNQDYHAGAYNDVPGTVNSTTGGCMMSYNTAKADCLCDGVVDL